ncbi:hypothetical protein INT80_12235 [Gallibacterium anatis]|uniref:Uncharacterized protein n=1 Tax=Gallibacterium anatis TaxID=750 RepID=A0A930UXC1_9PAST|nr:hypothetical protein [Gallibacterium anatis]
MQEQAQQLWLVVESFDNLAACETFAFLSGKQIEPVGDRTNCTETVITAAATRNGDKSSARITTA